MTVIYRAMTQSFIAAAENGDKRCMALKMLHHTASVLYAALDVTLPIAIWLELDVAGRFHAPWFKPALGCLVLMMASASLQGFLAVDNAGGWIWLEATGPVRTLSLRVF